MGALLSVVTGRVKLVEMLPSCNAATAAGQVAESRKEFAKLTMISLDGSDTGTASPSPLARGSNATSHEAGKSMRGLDSSW